jgi:1,4-dihydroxy-2-naphthoate octaprenyltransferase
MIRRATWLHWRVPFSFYLMPVFVLAWSVGGPAEAWRTAVAFAAMHLFLYPASNAYNSYYDKDEGSIGGLEKPPPVDGQLLWSAWALDGIGLLLGALLGWEFAAAMLLYGLVSKAYSHPGIRLKKRAWAGWLTVGIFQGAFAFFMAYMGIFGRGWSVFWEETWLWWPAGLSSAMLLGSYPMTQIYQHDEDARRGDRTISLLLGIRGTFAFTAAAFALASAGFAYFYTAYFHWRYALLFGLLLLPVLAYFLHWAWRAWQRPSAADFRSTMRLNLISACCMNGFYLLMGLGARGLW